MMSYSILRPAMRTKWMVQAPVRYQCFSISIFSECACWGSRKNTFAIDPVGVEIGQSGLVGKLIDRLLGLVVDLEDAARPPSPGCLLVGHIRGLVIDTGTATARGI